MRDLPLPTFPFADLIGAPAAPRRRSQRRDQRALASASNSTAPHSNALSSGRIGVVCQCLAGWFMRVSRSGGRPANSSQRV